MTVRSLHDALFGAIPDDSRITNPPLVSVVVQIQFPQILKIKQADEIAKFQESIRKDYPEYKQQIMPVLNVNPLQGVSQTQQITQQFLDEENKWTISLDESNISFFTTAYSVRADFLARFEKIISSFIAQFSPGRTKRIGLRYLNQITGERFAQIEKYVNKDLLGILASGVEINHLLTETQLVAKEGKILARWGKIPVNGTTDPALLPPKNAPTWIMDVDIVTDEKIAFEANRITSTVKALAERHYAVFDWMTTEALRTKVS